MHKLQNGSQAPDMPVLRNEIGTPGWFTESGEGGAPSYPGADWFNANIAEFQNILIGAGIKFDRNRFDHINRAIIKFVENEGSNFLHKDETISMQGLPWNKDRTYKTNETCTREINGEVVLFEMYRGPSATCVDKDPAYSENRQDGWTDETAPFYWTLAKKARPGAPLFPWFSMTFPEGTLNVLGNSVPAVVFWRLALAFPELVNIETGMIDFPETGGEFFRVLDQGRGVDVDRVISSAQTYSTESHQHSETNTGNPDGISTGMPAVFGQGLTVLDTSATREVPASALDSLEGDEIHSLTSSFGVEETRSRNLAFPILLEV